MKLRRAEPGVDLGGAWSFAFSEERVGGVIQSTADLRRAGLDTYEAEVPGNFELDLHANGLIDEPFFGMNIAGLRQFEGTYVYYVRSFQAPSRPGMRPSILFEGIDCFADVYLNGLLIHRADNMLIEHRVPVDDELRQGARNTLCVVLAPALERAREGGFSYPPGLDAEGAGYESLYVRKAPHMYGWDIMPRALSAGLWRPVTLEFLPPHQLSEIWLETLSIAADGSAATLELHYRAILDGSSAMEYAVRIAGECDASAFDHRQACLYDAGRLQFQLDSPLLWWPRGRGSANLYAIRVELLRGDEVVDFVTFKHGIRTVGLDRTSIVTDAGEGEFCFRVNGERVFVLGTNWVPLDAYHSRDAGKIGRALDMVEDLGCNMIRCWGGNVYENDLFFDLCDEKGILVWQDFAMACAIYPQDSDFQERMRTEVRQVVRRLRQHASLVMWAGDNECDQKYLWGSRRRDPNSNVLTREVVPGVLRDEDPSRPYLPSSPFVDEVAFAVGERFLPEDHLWGPRDYYKSVFYTSALCLFASEIGYHGCPEAASLRRFLTPDKVWPYTSNDEWLLHATSPIPGVDIHDYRVELMASQIRSLFGVVPDSVDEFAFASQSSQAEALKFFIESFRLAKWRRTGIIWWNLIDGWPQMSDAVVDYYFAKKRAYEIVKRSQAPVTVIAREPIDGIQGLAVANDTRNDVVVSFVVRDVDTGVTLFECEIEAAADAVTSAGSVAAPATLQRCLAIEWRSPVGPGRSHYLAGSPPFALDRYRRWMAEVGLAG